LAVLYSGVLRVDPKRPDWPERDYFILSKGHAASAIFSTLALAGFFNFSQLEESYGAYGSLFGCHPDRNKVPGIEASTGSLGHGMPFAVGVALGLKMRGKPNRVFTLIGDGEANEGSIWEAAMVAEHNQLDNLVCIMDLNNSQIRCLPVKQAGDKWRAFGWNVIEVDGHSTEQLQNAFASIGKEGKGRPLAVVANTVKGKGARMLETDFFAWHHRKPNETEYAQILGELK
jgi:transketolase